MLKIENTEVYGWEAAIRGMRNPMNSWDQSDSNVGCATGFCDSCNDWMEYNGCRGECAELIVGEKDLDLMRRLRKAGTDHRKFMRMITVSCDLVAPLYWWKEYDTYKVGTVANSCSTMHKIHAKEFELSDFSCEHLMDDEAFAYPLGGGWRGLSAIELLKANIEALNNARERYLATLHNPTKDNTTRSERAKKYWWQMIQLLPSSYNQRRTIMLNYEVLANIYKSRKNHKLDCWHTFCEWIEGLPYSELITGVAEDGAAC